MTTLYSATGLGSTLTVECDGDIVNLTAFSPAETRRAWANPKRADLLAALDAVPREDAAEENLPDKAPDWERIATNHIAALSRMTERAENAEADHAATKKAYRNLGASHAKLLEQRDALAATVERARALLAEADRIEMPVEAMRFTVKAGQWFQELRAALDPEPALPTEAGSLILLGDKPLCLNADGWWMGLDGGPFTAEYIESRGWKPAKVVAE